MLTPTYIFSDDFTSFETYFTQKEHVDRAYRKGDYLWTPDEPYSRIHYIRSGVTYNLLEHESGHRKIISFHGKGTVFPGYHRMQYKIEKSLLTMAMSDVEALEFTSEQFGNMFNENPELRMQVIDWFSSYTNLLLYETAHQEYNSSFVKLCNLLYLLLVSNNGKQNDLGSISQNTLADILGVSLVNLTRGLTRLRSEGIIKTSRQKIVVLNPDMLKYYCSYETV